MTNNTHRSWAHWGLALCRALLCVQALTSLRSFADDDMDDTIEQAEQNNPSSSLLVLHNGSVHFHFKLFRYLLRQKAKDDDNSNLAIASYPISKSLLLLRKSAKGNTKTALHRALTYDAISEDSELLENRMFFAQDRLDNNAPLKANACVWHPILSNPSPDTIEYAQDLDIDLKQLPHVSEQSNSKYFRRFVLNNWLKESISDKELSDADEDLLGSAEDLKVVSALSLQYSFGAPSPQNPNQLTDYLDRFEYYQNNEFEALALPCQKHLCMVLLAPSSDFRPSLAPLHSLRFFQRRDVSPYNILYKLAKKELCPSAWNNLLNHRLQARRGNVSMPRIQAHSFLNLSTPLSTAEGLALIFSSPADFRRFDKEGRLRVDKFLSVTQFDLLPQTSKDSSHSTSNSNDPDIPLLPLRNVSLDRPVIVVLYEEGTKDIVMLAVHTGT